MCGVKPARRPELAAEVKYLTWTGDNLLRQVVYERLREDKPAAEVRREVPIGKPDGVVGHSIVTRDGGLCPKADSPRGPHPRAGTGWWNSARAGSGISRSTSSSGPPARAICTARIFAIAASMSSN
jgi:hypothetical protein